MITARLKPSCDSKTRFYKTQKNTFGLMPGNGTHLLNGEICPGTCPGATTAPEGCWHVPQGRKNNTCYVHNLMKIYKAVGGVLAHNTRLLQAADFDGKVELLNLEFGRFSKAENRRDTPRLNYRLHWAGDIFDAEYAAALRKAITVNNDIQFWCYTRSFFAVSPLCDLPNLNLYLSLDPVNYAEGIATYAEYARPGQRRLAVCYMAKEKDFAKHEAATQAELVRRDITDEQQVKLATNPDYRVCPADTKKLKTEEACKTCGKCIFPTPSNVWFKV